MNRQKTTDHRPEVLLHLCCGPCGTYPAEVLIRERFAVRGFFSNPNIHPTEEHRRRREGAEHLAALRGFSLDCEQEEEVDEAPWREAANDEPGTLCRYCYRTRLEKTAQHARKLGIPLFTSTLLVSPYQQHDLICDLARTVAEENGVGFLYRDFRPGFRVGQQQAKEYGLYRQKYCGCLHSLAHSDFRDRILQEHEVMRDPSAQP